MKTILAGTIGSAVTIMMWVGYAAPTAPPTVEEPRNCWSYRDAPTTTPLPRPAEPTRSSFKGAKRPRPVATTRALKPDVEEPKNCWSYRDVPVNAKLPRQPKQIHGVGICGCCCGIGGPDLRADAIEVDTFTNGKRAPMRVDLTAVRAEHPSHPSGWKRVCADCMLPPLQRAQPSKPSKPSKPKRFCGVPKPLPPTKAPAKK